MARDGLEAVQLAATLRPALILLEVQIPKLDGMAAIRQIRAFPDLPRLPIIALTALAMPGDRERYLAAGADDFLSKPISLKLLTEVVGTFIHQPA